MTATEAAKGFGTIVDRVRAERATYVVERSGTPVAQIGPVDTRRRFTLRDLADLLAPRPGSDEAYRRAVEEGIDRHNRPAVPTDPWAR